MLGIVLKSLRIKNFGPFADEIKFTTAIDKSKKDHLENTFSLGDNSFNRTSFIFGANGSGKSNFCKALIQIQNFINLSPLFATNNQQLLELQPIKLSASELDKHFLFESSKKDCPSEYEIEIVMDGTTFSYSFAILDGLVVSEKLTKKKQRTEIILSRHSGDYHTIELKSELASFAPNVAVVKERALCLSMAAFLNNPLASQLIAAINRIQVVNMATLQGLRNITKESFTENIRQKCLNILQIAEPTMEDFSVEFTEEDVDKRKVPIFMDDLEDRELIIKNVRVDVQSTHFVYDQDAVVDKILLPFLKYESNGTIKMLSILPLLFQALESGSPIVIDEIENGLHPNIVQRILNLFIFSETNPNNAQLVCTTHSTPLVEKNVRRDQVWVVDKDSCGRSSLKRVSDYPGTRTTDNIAQKYLRDAFGDIPEFGSL